MSSRIGGAGGYQANPALCPVKFEAFRDAIVFRTGNLELPFVTSNSYFLFRIWYLCWKLTTICELPAATSMAGVNMRLGSGVVRELHWPKEAEWAYILKGDVRLTVVDGERNVFIDDLNEGDMWLVPAGIPHSIQGLADGTEFLLVFDDGNFSTVRLINDFNRPKFEDVSLNQRMALTPPDLVRGVSTWTIPPRGSSDGRTGRSLADFPKRAMCEIGIAGRATGNDR